MIKYGYFTVVSKNSRNKYITYGIDKTSDNNGWRIAYAFCAKDTFIKKRGREIVNGRLNVAKSIIVPVLENDRSDKVAFEVLQNFASVPSWVTRAIKSKRIKNFLV